jgi:hypothetical protein
MITKSVDAGCRSETTVNTFSDHVSSPRRLELPGQPLTTPHTAVPQSSPNATRTALSLVETRCLGQATRLVRSPSSYWISN